MAIRVDNSRALAGDLRRPEAAGDVALPVLRWCAYRGAGGAGDELPSARELVV